MKKEQLHGKRVTCKINGEKITDAKLSVGDDGGLFVCQNINDGAYCEEKFGYKYSWIIGYKKQLEEAKKLSDLNNYGVTDLKFVETRERKPKEIIENKGFLKACDADEKAIYSAEKYTCFSKKELERRDKQQITLTTPHLELTQDNKEQVILILLEEGYKVWEKEGLLYFEREK